MMTKYDISRVTELESRSIFFDANIILYLFWATGLEKCEAEYASLFQSLMTNKNRLYVDLTIISEVFNKAFDIEFEKYKDAHKNPHLNKKTYRDSEEGKIAVDDVYSLLKNTVLKHFEIAGKSFTKQEIIDLLIVDHLDFSDKIFLKICRENGFVLLTHDYDFRDAEIDILTANKKLVIA
ncbi:MAG: PIN domain-containing protein [Candidatus Delongbacteria bacterium]|nr:PIN domain-containing protein [Candidatus Delongbacteria bacterium]